MSKKESKFSLKIKTSFSREPENLLNENSVQSLPPEQIPPPENIYKNILIPRYCTRTPTKKR